VGAAYLLAGQTEEAIRWLEETTKICNGLWFPVEHTRAYARLGQAREAKGDPHGACTAYRVVLERWGSAKPRSVTAEAVKARVKALKCPR
jgi:serine/threonine-protein kinase